jgi:CAAX prenyl protease-like protein
MKERAWLPYVVPMALYMALMLAESPANVAWFYPVKVAAVAGALLYFRKSYEELRPGFSLWGVLVGLVAIAIWIGIEPYYPKLGESKPFDPTTIATPVWEWAFIGCRVFGAVVVVAFMEELFWRGFFIRWLVNEDFKSVPVGTITGLSFAVTVALFGVEHRDWLAGLICGALYNWLYYRRKNLMACVVAHAVSNAALAGWVLLRGDWKFW